MTRIQYGCCFGYSYHFGLIYTKTHVLKGKTLMGKICGLRAGGVRKDNVFFYWGPAKEDRIIYFGTTTGEAVSARPQAG